MNAIIIDDEKRARLSMQLLLEENCPNVHILADCDSLSQGVKAIRKFKPEIVFLDIEMPGHSGLELLDFFNEDEITFSIIFTTAYNEFAIRAFALSAVDYLLKPIDLAQLKNAVLRVQKNNNKIKNYDVLKDQINGDAASKIAIPMGSSLHFIELKNIVYLKGDGAYSELFTAHGEKMVASRNLKTFEDILCDNKVFIRVQKSYIVNINFIASYNKSDGGSLLLTTGSSIPVAQSRIALILENIKMLRR